MPFFAVLWAFLSFQVVFLQSDQQEIGQLHPFVERFVDLNAFILKDYGPLFAAITFFLLGLACLRRSDSRFSRSLFDLLGVYYLVRMAIQLLGLNILVFDSGSSPLLLITQLIFFLPYMLLVWGWVYWRLNRMGVSHGRPLFSLDHEAAMPRVIDYYVASFSTVFSASISNIKGTSARSRILILIHGFMIYNVMGLILSRAISLVQR
ncbi:MAG: hypothetical protein QUV07_02055 [Cyanobium sp. CZS 25K]|nr:hypothetical protein [Cyanobium sp. CZS25K]